MGREGGVRDFSGDESAEGLGVGKKFFFSRIFIFIVCLSCSFTNTFYFVFSLTAPLSSSVLLLRYCLFLSSVQSSYFAVLMLSSVVFPRGEPLSSIFFPRELLLLYVALCFSLRDSLPLASLVRLRGLFLQPFALCFPRDLFSLA